jgi:hypothetical protein
MNEAKKRGDKDPHIFKNLEMGSTNKRPKIFQTVSPFLPLP